MTAKEKAQATKITSCEVINDKIYVSWVNEYIGFGEFYCDTNYNVIDDECMGPIFDEYMIKLIKNI